MFGSASIISALTAPETLVLSVWRSGASAETSMVSPSPLTVSSTGTRTVSVVPTTMPVRLKGANPASVTVTVYVPACSCVTVNKPASVVTNSCETFVPSLMMTTVAPGTRRFLWIDDRAGNRRGSDLRVDDRCAGQAHEHEQRTEPLLQHN